MPEIEIVSYTPNPQQRKFHESNAKYRCFLGAVRGGKTKAGVWEGIDLSMQYPGNRGLIARKTYRELKDTTQRSFFEECPPRLIRNYQRSQELVELVDGSEIIFRSLDTMEKIKSLELGWWYLDEATETEHDVFKMLQSRLSLRTVPVHRGFITTNPPNIDHWIHREFVENKSPDFELIRSNTYDNRENLPPGYIEGLEKTYDPNWIRKYLMGEFGYDLKGKAVFYGYRQEVHQAKLALSPSRPVVRGWDFGFHHPCVVFSQVDPDGRWMIFKCVMGKDIYIQDFAPVILQLSNSWFPNMEFKDFGDPAGSFRKDSDLSTIRILKEEFNIHVEYQRSKVSHGVDLINQKMNTLIAGKPSLMVNKDETTRVIEEILMGAYYYQIGEEEPYKDGYYEHPADAMRYAAINLFANKPTRNLGSIKVGGPSYLTTMAGVAGGR